LEALMQIKGEQSSSSNIHALPPFRPSSADREFRS